MRVFIFLFFIQIWHTEAAGQISQGHWLVGGSGTYGSTRVIGLYGRYKISDIALEPNFGFFFLDKFAAGLVAKYSLTHYQWHPDPASDAKTASAGLGSFVRYYILPSDKRANLFVMARFLHEILAFSSQNPGNFSYYGGGGGLIYFLNKNLGLELSAEKMYAHEWKNKSRLNQFQVNFGLQIHVERK